jgi:hypothetical protein
VPSTRPLNGNSKGVTAIIIISILVVSGLSGALIGAMFSGTTEIVQGPEYESLNVKIEPRSFADYTEYESNYSLEAPQYELEPDLSNIINLDQFILSQEMKDAIADHYFTAVSSTANMFCDIYESNYQDSIPSFVTSDAVLHAYHVLYDVILRTIEEEHLMNHIGNLTRHLVEVSVNQYAQISDPVWKESAKKNVAFFSIATRLHSSSWIEPEFVSIWVNNAITLIEAASGFNSQWFMNQELDFSQFIPRGHYTKTETLERFFKVMMWLARVGFRPEPEDLWLSELQNKERGRNETAQAILLSRAFEQPSSLFSDGATPVKLWQSIYDTTAFFVGTSDDLTPHEYASLIDLIYEDPSNYTELCDSDKLGVFIETALTCRDPQILSGSLFDSQSISVTKGLRFMGQRFVPDSYIFSELTHRQVVDRMLPKGLDVMAVLGSNRAWDLLDDQKMFENYTIQMTRLQDRYLGLNMSTWTQNLYWQWLYSFKTLLDEPEAGHPSFMMSQEWLDKQLVTSLGTWTELRHDTILFAKQSYTSRPYYSPSPPPGYVEPVPEFYARLASLCKMMIDGLGDRHLISEEITPRLEYLHSLLLNLKTISEKELSGTSLNETERDRLRYIGKTLAFIEGSSDKGGKAALIADVHTDPNTRQVLEEATGNPLIVFVAVPTESGETFIAKGAMYSHFEFAWPMSDRLTDEAWWDLMESDEAPAMAEWTGSFVIGISSSPVQNRPRSLTSEHEIVDQSHQHLQAIVSRMLIVEVEGEWTCLSLSLKRAYIYISCR